MKYLSYYNFFKNFANKLRLNILLLLRKNPQSVNELINKLGEEQSKISHHLKYLRTCHLVKIKIKGKKRIYSLNKKTVLPLLKIVEKHVKKNCPFNCNKFKKCS